MSTADIATIGFGVDARPIKDANKDLDSMDNIASKLTKTVKNFIGAWAGWKTIKAIIVDSALLNARFETMGVAMNMVGKNAGYSSTQMHEYELSLRKAGIAQIEARETLSRMAQAQLDLSKTTELARVAQDAAVIGGINSSEAFERLVNGIQTAQTETLRTIGINVNFQKSYEDMAKQLGVNVNTLNENQKAQARMNIVLEYGARIAGTYEAAMGTAGKQLTSMRRYIDDLKVKFGEVFNEALTASVFGVADGFKSANHQLDELAKNDSIERWGQGVKLVLVAIAETLNTITVGVEKFSVGLAHTSAARSINVDFNSRLTDLQKNAGSDYGVKAAALEKQRQDALKNEEAMYHDTLAGLNKRVGAIWRAAEDQKKIKDQARADDLAKEKKYLADLAVVRSKYANAPLATQQDAMKALASSYYPNEPVGYVPPTSGTTVDKKSSDAIKTFVDDLKKEVATYGMSDSAIKQYEASKLKLTGTTLKLVNSLIAQMKAQSDEQRSAEINNQLFDDAIEKQDKLNSVIEDAIKSTRLWSEEAIFESGLIGKTNEQREVATKLRELEIAKIDKESDAYRQLKKIIEDAAKAKYMISGPQERLQQSTSIVSAAEQSYQSRVTAGLVSESEARVKLREIIGQQGLALQAELLPQIKAVMAATTDAKTLADMQAMIDKINEMVAVGKQTTFYEGLKSGLKEYAKSATDVFTTVKDMTVNAFKSMEDALVDFVMTGKLNFSNFANSVIKDLVRIAVQENITKPLASAASNGIGSILSTVFSAMAADGKAFSGGKVQAYASGGVLGTNGGIFPGPTIFPMANGGIGLGGEAGDEAAMPLKRLSNGKLGVHADSGRGSSSVAVSVTINDNRTTTETKKSGNDALAPKLGEMIKSVVQAKLIEEMRPGGILAS